MNCFNKWTVCLLLSICFISEVRCDPVEGSRLLEESFRDYDKRIRPNYGGDPVIVNVSIHILSISEVNTMAQTYTMTFFMRQIWNDPRLMFNSRRNIDLITLDASTAERIWIPDTFFPHDVSSVNHDVLMKNQFCRIAQDGLILFSRRVTLTTFSPMSSDLFPYDSHKLSLEMESYGFQMKDVKYQWAPEAISASSHNAPGFHLYGTVAKDSSKTTSTGSYSGLTIEMDVKRNPLPYELGFMLSTFILSLLCLGSTSSTRVNPSQGVNASFILVSMIAGLYVILSLNILPNVGIPKCMTVLQLYVLLSGGFGLICFLVNVRRNQESSSVQSSIKQTGNDAFAESTPENRKNDGLHVDTSASEENKQGECSMKNEKQAAWGKFSNNLRNCGSRRDGCSGWSLWIAVIIMNVIFVLFFRLIH